MPLLELTGVVSGYKKVSVLHGVSLRVEASEIVAVVGSNGAGKTTLLKTISGLLAPTAGAIRFSDQSIGGLPPHAIVARGIVQVPEGRQLFPHLTVTQHLQIGSYPPEARQRRAESMEMVFALFPVLGERRSQEARTLSGGEQQMLAAARALMTRPTLLMLDEPSWGLAPMMVTRLFETICRINEAGCTVLLVEQHIRKALGIAKRAYVMERGQMVLEGKASDLLHDERLKDSYLGRQ